MSVRRLKAGALKAGVLKAGAAKAENRKARPRLLGDPASVADFRRDLLAWFAAAQRDLPWRRTRDPYGIWISEIMLQQTRVQAVIGYYEAFLARFPTLEALAAAELSTVLAQWSGLGYYSRARNLHRAAKVIAEPVIAKPASRDHGGGFPRTYDGIRALPGIGDYTAAAVASIAFDLPHAVLDGNVIRVISRLTNDASDSSLPATRNRQAVLVPGSPTITSIVRFGHNPIVTQLCEPRVLAVWPNLRRSGSVFAVQPCAAFFSTTTNWLERLMKRPAPLLMQRTAAIPTTGSFVIPRNWTTTPEPGVLAGRQSRKQTLPRSSRARVKMAVRFMGTRPVNSGSAEQARLKRA